ncbi:MAG: phosphate signaling complex protein PhoU [Chloroflexi bacterium]|nr:phosphate signaling complex protein PhoU [Chloroflexota bacterium]
MVRIAFEKHLQELQDDVLAMGSMVDKAIDRSVESLKRRDLDLARQVIADDAKINQARFDIEEKCVHLIATQQPIASDLRILVAVLNIIVDLERMGDHAEGIARVNVLMGDMPLVKPLIDIPRMAQKSRGMLNRSLTAFVNRDAEDAKRICAEDDEVDNLYDQVYRELITIMLGDPRTITPATYLLWAAHNLERVADRTTNISERVVFLVSGHMQELASRF